jgi:hypothetical protein
VEQKVSREHDFSGRQKGIFRTLVMLQTQATLQGKQKKKQQQEK